MTYLAVSIAAADSEAALKALRQAAAVADVAELRLDLMPRCDLPRLLAERPLPIIVTCRPRREGGAWPGDEAQRLALLRQAATLGADYVDLEWDVAAQAASLDRSRTRVILSRHDFEGLSPALPLWAARLGQAGADVVKVVGAARGLADTAPVWRTLAAAARPTIAIAMGPSGLLTRLLAFRYGQAFLSFGALGRPTAAGQIAAPIMRQRYRVQALSERTTLIGLLAPQANESPLLEAGNAWLAQQGLNAVLAPLQVGVGEAPQRALDALLAALPWLGCLVQPPYQKLGLDRPAAAPSSRRPATTLDVLFTAAGQRRGARLGGLAERLSWLLSQAG